MQSRQGHTVWFHVFSLTLWHDFPAYYGAMPCVMCIYQRIATHGIMGAALVGLITPPNIAL